MAIKKGTDSIVKVYRGATEITKIYKGTELIYSASPTPQPTLSNKIYGHTRSASSTITLKVNGTSYNVTSEANKYFELDCSNITITSLNQCAYNIGQLADITFDVDTSACTDFSYMVASCSYATSIDCAKIDTSASLNFAAMFYNAQSATITPPSAGWQHASNVWNIQFMFYNCKKMTRLDMSTLGYAYTISNTNGFCNGCTALETIDFTGLEEFEPAYTLNLFLNCSSLTTINVTDADATSISTLLSCLSSSGLSFVQSGDYLIKQS